MKKHLLSGVAALVLVAGVATASGAQVTPPGGIPAAPGPVNTFAPTNPAPAPTIPSVGSQTTQPTPAPGSSISPSGASPSPMASSTP